MRKENGVLTIVTEDDIKLLKSNPKEFWKGVTNIEEWAFCDCSSLTSITIPQSVTEIGRGAFSACSSLTSVTIPEGVTKIGERTFEYCSSLTSVIIPNSMTKIGEYAFLGCSNLREIILPEGVEIEEDAFAGCPDLIAWVKANDKANPNESAPVKPVSRFRKMLEKLGKLFGKPDESESNHNHENV